MRKVLMIALLAGSFGCTNSFATYYSIATQACLGSLLVDDGFRIENFHVKSINKDAHMSTIITSPDIYTGYAHFTGVASPRVGDLEVYFDVSGKDKSGKETTWHWHGTETCFLIGDVVSKNTVKIHSRGSVSKYFVAKRHLDKDFYNQYDYTVEKVK